MDGNKKLIEGRFRNPLVEYLKDNEWVFTEKVDGTNIRVFCFHPYLFQKLFLFYEDVYKRQLLETSIQVVHGCRQLVS